MTKKTIKVEKKVALKAETLKPSKVETLKVETPKTKGNRVVVLEAEIQNLQGQIDAKNVEVSKEMPLPETLVGETEEFKKPSLATRKQTHTKTEMKKIVEAWRIKHKDNPAKLARKKSELESKIREAR